MGLTFEELRTLIVQSPYQEFIISLICFVGIVIALANCFCGYRLIGLWTTLLGASIGAVLANYISQMYTDSLFVRICAVVLAALVLGALAYRIRFIGTFLLCGAMAFSLAFYFLYFVFDFGDILVQLLLAAIAGIVCGLLTQRYKRTAIMAITAVCGSYTTLSTIIHRLKLNHPLWVFWILVILITFLGFVVQFTTYRINESKKITRQKKGGSR